jgi:hypothetical protein
VIFYFLALFWIWAAVLLVAILADAIKAKSAGEAAWDALLLANAVIWAVDNLRGWIKKRNAT